MNTCHVKKQSTTVFKVGFEKAYDKLKCPLVLQIVKLKGFPEKWIDKIVFTNRPRHVRVKLMLLLAHNPTHKGLGKGDSLSTVIFDLAADVLAM